MAVRRETLCPGGPLACTEACTVTCCECGEPREPDDIREPGYCETCGSKQYVRERCADCDVTKLEIAMQSPFGVLLSHVATIDTFKERGFSLSLSDVTAEEARALEVLWAERDRYQEERDRERARRHG